MSHLHTRGAGYDLACRPLSAPQVPRLSPAFSANHDTTVFDSIAHTGSNNLCHRRFVRAVGGQGGTGVSERTSNFFFLPAASVDRLRAAAGKIILESPDFQQLLRDVGARIVVDPTRKEAMPIAPIDER